MFGFLKEKLKKAAQIFSKKVEDEGESLSSEETIGKEPIEELEESQKIEELQISQEEKEKPVERPKKEKLKKVISQKEKKKKVIEEEPEEEPAQLQEITPTVEEKREIIPLFAGDVINEKEEKSLSSEETLGKEQKKGWFARLKEKVTEKVTTKRINAEQFEDFFYELEIALMENNVAGEVIEKIKSDLKGQLVDKPLRKGEIEREIEESLVRTIEDVLGESDFDLLKAVKEKKEKPYVVLFVGVNGSGKTTSIAKIAHLLKQNHLTSVLVAGDTWRKAAIEQLEEHGKKLGLKVIKHQYGSDPAAVAYDGVSFSKTHHVDAVLIDTAGRQHSNQNLMKEMEKIVRVIRPDLKLFVGEAITGNDVVEQTRRFNEAIEIDGIILTKSDVDEKGGAILSARYVTQKPILFLGVGQNLEDLKVFDKKEVITSLGF